jgi:hypothetical protein
MRSWLSYIHIASIAAAAHLPESCRQRPSAPDPPALTAQWGFPEAQAQLGLQAAEAIGTAIEPGQQLLGIFTGRPQ